MRKSATIALALFLGLAATARALVIAGGNGTANFSAPSDDPGWSNVASNGVYLGNYNGAYWAITATHVGPGDMVLGGQTYTYVPGSAVPVLNANSSTSDLTLFRLASNPGLPTLALATSNPTTNDIVTLVGDGLMEGSFKRWTVNTTTNPDTWTEVGSGGDMFGYSEISGAGKRWGLAVVAGTATVSVSGRPTATYYTEFIAANGSSQAASGDSGGAAFFKIGGTWYLNGIISAVATYNSGATPDGQPGSTAVFGNVTFMSSIADYNSFIVSVVPEPATWAGWAGALALGVVAFRRKMNKAR